MTRAPATSAHTPAPTHASPSTTGRVTTLEASAPAATLSSSTRFRRRLSGTRRSAAMGKVNPTTLSTGDKRGVANQPEIRGETAYKSTYARPDNATVDQKQAFS